MSEPPIGVVEQVRIRRTAPPPALAKAIRQAAGLSQDALAKELGVSRITVLRWESGERKPRGAAAVRYARLLAELKAVVG